MSPRKDPVTGDQLTAVEYYSRQLQAMVRSPWFLVVFNVITGICMLIGWRDPWNWFASWLAIMVEWMVGKYMFGQTARDAVILRKLLQLEEQLLHDVEDEDDSRHCKDSQRAG